MNTLTHDDAMLFYSTFRALLDYANHRFHVKEDYDFRTTPELDYELALEVSNLVWASPSVIDDLLREGGDDLSDEMRSILPGWKNCVSGPFFVERHLSGGSIFINQAGKVYQVLGINDPLKEAFWDYPEPTLVDTVLLPFRNSIITTGIWQLQPVYFGGGVRDQLKGIYMKAKGERKIICTLPEPAEPSLQNTKKGSVSARGASAQTKKKSEKTKASVNLYRLKVYPKGNSRSVYRVIEICGNATLNKLCSVILDAFDFTSDHLFEFCMDNSMYDPDNFQSHPEHGERSTKISLDRLGLYAGQNFSLHYDFGDDWMFVIHVNAIAEAEKQSQPRITKSAGSIEQYPDGYVDFDDFDDDDFDDDDEE